jgi:hypothetical protein
MSKYQAKTARRAINRLAVACHDEVLALDAAARNLGGERGARLRYQSARRAVFLTDLRRGVLALGGVPASGASYYARTRSALCAGRELVTGSDRVKAYVDCMRATLKTANAYANALGLELPPDARFGMESQQAEIQFDHRELRWLRFGGSLSDPPHGVLALASALPKRAACGAN